MLSEFKNINSFLLVLGVGLFAYSPNVENKVLGLILAIAGLFMSITSTIKLLSVQINKDRLVELERERYEAKLDFDIINAIATNHLCLEPEFNINDEQIGVNEISQNDIKIMLNVFNNSIIDNEIRDIKVNVINKRNGKSTTYDIRSFSPSYIPSRKHLSLEINATKMSIPHINHDDKLMVSIYSMDKKLTKHEKTITNIIDKEW